LTLSKQLLL